MDIERLDRSDREQWDVQRVGPRLLLARRVHAGRRIAPAEGRQLGGGINATGDIVGNSAGHAFLGRAGTLIDLGTLGGQSQALAINDARQLTRNSEVAPNVNHAFLWQDGVMTDLGILAGRPAPRRRSTCPASSSAPARPPLATATRSWRAPGMAQHGPAGAKRERLTACRPTRRRPASEPHPTFAGDDRR